MPILNHWKYLLDRSVGPYIDLGSYMGPYQDSWLHVLDSWMGPYRDLGSTPLLVPWAHTGQLATLLK